VCGSLVGIVAE